MINRTSQLLPSEVPRRLAAAEKAVRDMKNKQFLGGDNVALAVLGPSMVSVTLTPGQVHFYIFNFTGSVHQLYQSELSLSFYINNDLDPTFLWPAGSNLNTTELTAFDRSAHYDNQLSDEVGTGVKTYVLKIANTGVTNNKTIYARVGLIFPKAAIS